MSPTEEIKNRLDIVDFISGYVELKRAGANFRARCPFHSEKTPSFMVSRPKQLWYCFGACNEGGDIFKFLMKIEGLDFPEALKILADKAGVVLPKYDKQAESKKNTLLDIMKNAVNFYIKQLKSPIGALARGYLIKRGLSDAVIKQFGLGYAPDSWDALITALRDQFKPEDIFAAGLTIRKNRDVSNFVAQNLETSLFYDRFRHRLMFPIRDIHGNAIGFTSRILDETRKEGKYVNTPETLIYNKSRALYGLDLARQKIRELDYAVIVEGNMDVIACHQFGMTNVVASSGTALTIDQIRMLKRYTNNIMISFDADPAGENASKRGIDLALSEGLRVKVIVIPENCGKDPDECARKDIKVWGTAVRGAKEIMAYYFDKAISRFNIKTAQGRSQFANLLLGEIAKQPDIVEQDFWLKKIGETIGMDEKLLREQMKKSHNPTHPLSPPSPLPQGEGRVRGPRIERLSERLMAILITFPQHANDIISQILPEMLFPENTRDLYAKLVMRYTAESGGSHSIDDLDLDILELYGAKEFSDWSADQVKREIQFLIQEIKRDCLRQRRGELAVDMRRAEEQNDRAKSEEIVREFEKLDI